MAGTCHRFALGDRAAIVVSDGPLALGPFEEIFFGPSLPAARAALAAQGRPSGPVRAPQNALLLDGPDGRLLFDAGMGASRMLGPEAGRLTAHLAASGIAPATIDAVLLTHAHCDHAWGLVGPDSKPAFPNARVVVGEAVLAEWEASSASDGTAAPNGYAETSRRALEAVRGRIESIPADARARPGIHSVATPGHTAGHLSYRVESGAEALVVLGDVVNDPVQLAYPDLSCVFDADHPRAAATRRAMLDRLAEEGTPVLAYHMPFPGLGRVVREAGAFAWRPLGAASEV